MSAAANGILAKVQEAQLNDNILESINIEADTLNWWTLLYIMELVNHYLTKR
jgi:molybdenum cofactor biosynthesis enzyme MoaA